MSVRETITNLAQFSKEERATMNYIIDNMFELYKKMESDESRKFFEMVHNSLNRKETVCEMPAKEEDKGLLIHTCTVCGKSSTSFCECARKRLNEQTESDDRLVNANKKWEYTKKNSMGLCTICSVCGGSSVSFCECARKRFINAELRKEDDGTDRLAEANKKWEHRKKNSVGVCALCSVCRESISFCECVRKRFIEAELRKD